MKASSLTSSNTPAIAAFLDAVKPLANPDTGRFTTGATYQVALERFGIADKNKCRNILHHLTEKGVLIHPARGEYQEAPGWRASVAETPATRTACKSTAFNASLRRDLEELRGDCERKARIAELEARRDTLQAQIEPLQKELDHVLLDISNLRRPDCATAAQVARLLAEVLDNWPE